MKKFISIVISTYNEDANIEELSKQVEFKKLQIKNLIIKTCQMQVVNEPEALFYKGTKVLSENLNYLNKRFIRLENHQINYNIILQKFITFPNNPISLPSYFALGLMLGLFLYLVIIY